MNTLCEKTNYDKFVPPLHKKKNIAVEITIPEFKLYNRHIVIIIG